MTPVFKFLVSPGPVCSYSKLFIGTFYAYKITTHQYKSHVDYHTFIS